jgi:methanethiol S-methyltransferase
MFSSFTGVRQMASPEEQNDGGSPADPRRLIPMADQNYILLSFLWIAYCFVHSALISVTATNFLRRVLGSKYRFYRLFFNIFSVGTLILLLAYSYSGHRQEETLLSWENLRIVQYALIALGGILLLTAARHYSMLQFLGIKQVLQGRSGGNMTASGELDTDGVLRVVRHPWYLGVFLLLWASDIAPRRLMINLVLSAYLVIGTFLEERKLVLEFGDRYREYQHRVSMFIPLKWLKSRLPL